MLVSHEFQCPSSRRIPISLIGKKNTIFRNPCARINATTFMPFQTLVLFPITAHFFRFPTEKPCQIYHVRTICQEPRFPNLLTLVFHRRSDPLSPLCKFKMHIPKSAICSNYFKCFLCRGIKSSIISNIDLRLLCIRSITDLFDFFVVESSWFFQQNIFYSYMQYRNTSIL